MWMPLNPNHLPQTTPTLKSQHTPHGTCTSRWQWVPQWTVRSATPQKTLRNCQKNVTTSIKEHGLKIPRCKSVWAAMASVWKRSIKVHLTFFSPLLEWSAVVCVYINKNPLNQFFLDKDVCLVTWLSFILFECDHFGYACLVQLIKALRGNSVSSLLLFPPTLLITFSLSFSPLRKTQTKAVKKPTKKKTMTNNAETPPWGLPVHIHRLHRSTHSLQCRPSFLCLVSTQTHYCIYVSNT